MLQNKLEDVNYRAMVVKMPILREHPNADRLAIATIKGQNIITSKDAPEGQLCVMFPLECQINSEFLSFVNGFRDTELNQDTTKKGLFEKQGRVRAQKLRSVFSEGYLHPVKEINEWLQHQGINYQITESDEGVEFDSIGDTVFLKKYVSAETRRRLERVKNQSKGGRVKRESRLVDNQFRLPPDTKHLKREMESIYPDDWIEITSKWHGASGTISRVLTKRPLSFVEKTARFLGAKIEESQYDLVFASRRVVKNEFADQQTSDFYDHNIWQIVAEKYKDCILDGITCYGEVCGYTPSGAGIQSLRGKVYDYGCKPKECDFFVYRMTYTSPSGNVFEFSLQQVVDYCSRLGLKHLPVFYIGKAKDKYSELDTENHWRENFLGKLMEEYLEKECIYCMNQGLPDEGVVVSKRVDGWESFKLKSSRFLEAESKQLDKNEENIEEAN